MDAKLITLVGIGSAIGGIARYAVAGWTTTGDFPTGTLVVNVTGSLLIGLVVFGGTVGGFLTAEHRTFVAIGLLGGFTTMSTFSYETLALVEQNTPGPALLYVGLTLLGSLAAVWAGRAIALALWSGGA